jgi:hypothetical protein
MLLGLYFQYLPWPVIADKLIHSLPDYAPTGVGSFGVKSPGNALFVGVA